MQKNLMVRLAQESKFGKVPAKQTALKRWMAMDMR
jgi:hypothetical protein